MKKVSRKFVLHRETVQILTNLDLARAAGGFDTGRSECPALAAYESGRALRTEAASELGCAE
jgi:hypothetical protein